MANQMTVEIENLKCGGCENTIVKGLMSITGVAGVIVDHAQKAVVLEADANLRPQVGRSCWAWAIQKKDQWLDSIKALRLQNRL